MCVVRMHMCMFSCVRAHVSVSVGPMCMCKWEFMLVLDLPQFLPILFIAVGSLG